MTYDEVRRYCIRWGNMHPDTQGSVSDIIDGMHRDFTYPQRGLLMVLAAYVDQAPSPPQHSEESGAPRREAGDRAGPLVSRQPNDSFDNPGEQNE